MIASKKALPLITKGTFFYIVQVILPDKVNINFSSSVANNMTNMYLIVLFINISTKGQGCFRGS